MSGRETLELLLELEKRFSGSPCVWREEAAVIDAVYNAAERVKGYIREGFGHLKIHRNSSTGGNRVERVWEGEGEKRRYEVSLEGIYVEEIGRPGTYEMGKNIIRYYNMLPC